MMEKIASWILLAILLGFGCCEQKQLELSIVIHRHGERSPLHHYKGQAEAAKLWPEGLGELTKRGKLEEYNLGLYLKKRYSGFLKDYHAGDSYFRSTSTSRTLMSAQLVAAALYPAKDEQAWNNISGLNLWQPIPVYTLPENEDYLLKPYKVSCPKAEMEAEKFQESDRYTKFKKEYASLFEKLTNKCGVTVTHENFTRVYDAIYGDMMLELKQPSWVHSIWPTLEKCRNELAMMRAPTFELKRLYGGYMIKNIIQRCKDKIEQKSPKQIYDYSAHDKTISMLMDSLGIHNGKIPPYSSALMFELWKANANKSHPYQLYIYFRNKTRNNPYELTLKGCKNKTCYFQEFVDATEKLIPGDRDEECKVEKKPVTKEEHHNEDNSATATNVMHASLMITFLLLIN